MMAPMTDRLAQQMQPTSLSFSQLALNFHVTKRNGHGSPDMRSEGGAVPTAHSTGGSN